MNILVQTTSPGPPPASASALSMISRQRRAWTPGSGSTDPSGQIGAVPATMTRSPTRTARLNPTVVSNGLPEEMFWRSMPPTLAQPAVRSTRVFALLVPAAVRYAQSALMRALRFSSIIIVVTVAVSTLAAAGPLAFAQTTEDAEEQAEEAERQAEVAEGLVDSALAERAEVEAELAESISRISDLSAELSRFSSSLDTLRAQIGFADSELSGIKSDLETHAIDAYMTALVTPGVTFVNSSTVERAMVAGQVVDDVVTSGKQRVDELVIKRHALEQLQIDYRNQQEHVAALKAEVDAEVERLAALYDEADSAVGQAIREATAADAAHREALSAVDAAQAREAEKRRQEERATTTTTPSSPETTPPATGSPTTTSPPSADPPDEGGGNWEFPGAVEQWRSAVQQHFPAGRVDEALRIIQCESLGDPDAYNPYSGASGLFQFLPSTWATTAPKAGFSGASVFDPTANIGSAAWLANRYQALGMSYWQPWSCRRVLS